MNLPQPSEKLIEIEFFNRTRNVMNIWVEPTCVSIDLVDNMEYKIISHDKSFRIEFDKEGQIIFYLQYSFGFKLYKRTTNGEIINKADWILDFDCSDIN